jgi:DNA polymerase III sliding clamp (beta) subunit (PCNA family)
MQHETMSPETATDARAIVTLAGRELRDAVKLLTSKLVERRQTVPVLAAIHFDIAPDGAATLTATDCDVWASLTLAANGDSIDAIEPGRFCLDAAGLHKLLSKLGKVDRLRLTDTGAGRVILKAGRSEYKLPARNADDFPLVPIAAYRAESGGAIDRAQFLRDLAALAPAMSDEPARQYLNGIALQVRQLAGRDRFAMAATDGYMMAAASRDLLPGFESWGAAIMWRKAVAFTLAADKLAGAGDLTLSRSREFIATECGALRIVSKLVDATYPEWPMAFEQMLAPTDEGQGALFPDLLPEWPLARTEALQKASARAIEWRGGFGGVIGECAGDPGMMWGAMYRGGNPATGRDYDCGVTVDVAGDREYPVPIPGAKIGLTKEQVAALCGDSLWEVLEFPGADGKPRYVSQWLWDDGATRLLCVGADGRCPKAGAVREYVTRAEVEAALAGDPIAVASEAVSAPESAPVCVAEPAPATHAAETVEIAPLSAPVAAEAVIDADGDPIAAVRARLAEIEALLAALPAQSVPAKRTAAHERAIRRAWAERKARREAETHLRIGRAQHEQLRAQYENAAEARTEFLRGMNDSVAREGAIMAKRRRAVLGAFAARKRTRHFIGQMLAEYDRRNAAESEAREAQAMRDEMRGMLAALERRAEAAESENAELWAEIEALTAPSIPVQQGAIAVAGGAA